MKNVIQCLLSACLIMGAVLSGGKNVWAEGYSPVYDHVLAALQQLPHDGGITVNFGVEESRYQERFKLTDSTFQVLREAQVPGALGAKLEPLAGQEFSAREDFVQAVTQAVGEDLFGQYEFQILNSAYEGMAVFNFGEKFEVRFQTDTTCYVALIHIAELVDQGNSQNASKEVSGGHIAVLLPNRKFPDAQLQAGQVYSSVQDFSIDLTASEPAGYEVMNIICSTEPFDFFAANGTWYQDHYYVIAPTDEAQLQKFLEGLQQLEPGKIGGSSLLLRIGGQTRRLPKRFGAIPPMGATGTTGKFFPPVSSENSLGTP